MTILRLLKEQLLLVPRIALESRVDASFLCEVLLTDSSKHIDVPVLNEIADCCEALRWVNAQAHIREVYIAHDSAVSCNRYLRFVTNSYDHSGNNRFTDAARDLVDRSGKIRSRSLDQCFP